MRCMHGCAEDCQSEFTIERGEHGKLRSYPCGNDGTNVTFTLTSLERMIASRRQPGGRPVR